MNYENAPEPMAADEGDPGGTADQDSLLNEARNVWLIAENRVERLEKLDEEIQRLWFFLGGQWIPDEPPIPSENGLSALAYPTSTMEATDRHRRFVMSELEDARRARLAARSLLQRVECLDRGDD